MEANKKPQRRREEGKPKECDVQGHVGFPKIKQMLLKVRTSSLERQIARNRSRIGKKLPEGESGKQDELKREQERRKSEPRAAEKRPKSTDKH